MASSRGYQSPRDQHGHYVAGWITDNYLDGSDIHHSRKPRYQHRQHYTGIAMDEFPGHEHHQGTSEPGSNRMDDPFRNGTPPGERHQYFSNSYASEDILRDRSPAFLAVNEHNPILGDGSKDGEKMKRRNSFGSLYPIVTLSCASALFVLTIIYSTTPLHLKDGRLLTGSASDSILVLRILSEANTLLLTAVVATAFEYIQWSLASRTTGLTLASFLGLDAGTGLHSLLRLMTSWAGTSHRYWTVVRVCSLILIPVSGILLMANIQAKPIYQTKTSFPAAAGIADFEPARTANISVAISMLMLMDYGKYLSDPVESYPLSPLPKGQGHCHDNDDSTKWARCDDAYFMGGAMYSVTPLADNFTTFPEATAYVVPKTKGYHVEFGSIGNHSVFRSEANCTIYGGENAAIQLCLSTGSDGRILFEALPCPLPLMLFGSCLSNSSAWTPDPGMSTSLSVYRRTGTVSYSRGNFSILSIEDLNTPTRADISTAGLFQVFDAIFHSQIFGTGATSPFAVVAANALPVTDVALPKSFALKFLRNFLILPLQYWQANYPTTGRWDEFTAPRPGLPSEMYTSVSIAIPSYHVQPGKWSLRGFIAVAGSLLTLCLGSFVFAAVRAPDRPKRTGFPTLDFAANCRILPGDATPGATLASLRGRGEGAFKKELRRRRVVC